MNNYPTARRLIDEGATYYEASIVTGIKYPTLRKHALKHDWPPAKKRPPRTTYNYAQAKKLLYNGTPLPDAAKQTGIPYYTLHAAATRYKWPKPRVRPPRKFPEQYARAKELYEQGSTTNAAIVKRLGIGRTTLTRWARDGDWARPRQNPAPTEKPGPKPDDSPAKTMTDPSLFED